MVQFNFTYDPTISVEQRVGFELAAMIWSSYLTDDITVNLHIASSDSLGENGQAVGGAIPLFHEQNYGVYQQYAEADATSDTDTEALASQQEGNTVDFLVDGQVVDGNTDILLTSAQAKALGMDEALTLENGGIWDRNLVDANSLDGYILVSNSFDWNYDYTRSGEAPEGTLDFMSMALHEIGHQLGFVSSLDGTLDMNTLYSGETQAEGFSVLDLFRHSIDSNQVENPDGAVTDLSLGQNSYFSTDGGATNLANFANGVDYQASHWKRMQVALGIMDPTLAYTERVSLNALDLQAMDVLGWDINYNALDAGLDLDALLLLAENKVETSLGLSSTALDSSRGGGEHGDLYTLGYGEWWAIFEKHVLELGYGEWWSIFEMGYGEWQQQFGENGLELGYGEWWQAFEANVLELGYGEWWQTFEADMLELGYGEWWQLLELGYGEWWQKLEKFFFTLDKVDGNATTDNSTVADGGVAGEEAKVYRGGENDDIIAGDQKQDRISAGAGDDLVDGKEGHDVIWGEAGDDVIYGQDGNDLIYGGDDDDLLLGEADDDELHGEAGHDIVSGGSGDDIVTGGEGKDDLKGGWGHDVLDGGGGDDRLEGEAGSDILIGGEGRDQVNGGGGDDVLYGDDYEGPESLSQLRTQLQAFAKENGERVEDNGIVPVNTSFSPIRVEAEDMFLNGNFGIKTYYTYDSGHTVWTADNMTATTVFTGESGRYVVLASYLDGYHQDTATLDFGLNGNALNSFNIDQNTNLFYTQTVAQDITLNTGDVLTVAATANGGDNAFFDYLEIVSLDNLLVTALDPVSSEPDNAAGSSPESSSWSENSVVRVEAEAMTLLGDFFIANDSLASGNQLIGADIQSEAKALTTFGGEAGYYDIVVSYFNESGGGTGQISTGLNDTTLDVWFVDQGLENSSLTALTRTVASTVLLNTGDIFELTSLRGMYQSSVVNQNALIDYVDFVKVNPLEATPTNTLTETNNDLVNNNSAEAGLVAHWTFDETSGVVALDTTAAHNATLRNADNNSQWGAGQLGGALNLDGVNDYVAIADSSEINLGTHAQRTVSVWFKVDDPSIAAQKQVIYEEGGGTRGLNLYIHDGQLYAGGWNRDSRQSDWSGTYLQTDEIVAGQWHHVALVLDADNQVRDRAFTAYLDGEVFGVGEGATLYSRADDNGLGAINGGTRFHDGSSGSTSSHALAGSLDEVRIYNRALDSDEILTMVGPNNDLLQGGAGNDTLYGGEGNDTLYGESAGAHSSFRFKGSQTYNGHTYLFSSISTWHEAQAEAQKLGGNLLTLNNATEEDWVKSTFGTNEKLFIGINDQRIEGQFEWVSGEAVTYTNWAPGEPSNHLGNQDFGTMNFLSQRQWDDEFNDAQLRGIIEIDDTFNDILMGGSGDDTLYGGAGDDTLYGETASDYAISQRPGSQTYTYNGHTYLLSNLGTWAEAQAEAETLGGNLLTLNNAAEEDWVKSIFGTQEYFFIGINDQRVEGQFEWASGEAVTYTNWAPGEPNNNAGLEDFGVLNYGSSKQWNDVRSTDTFIGIIEINSVPSVEAGNDALYGGIGSDILEGGAGNDVLDGSDDISAGYFETDILSGGLGADTFVLGNATQAYYLGQGQQDYAVIQDFNAAEDIVQLHGSAGDYTQQQQGNDTYLSYQGNTSELVAVFKNLSSVNLNVGFSFV